jgi:D-psicose/D-tagatose/L-ribulose 3-epimerase
VRAVGLDGAGEAAPRNTISACEWIFAGEPLGDVLARLSAAGCEGIELSGEPHRPDRGELRALLDSAGMRATCITAICPAPTDDRDLAHTDAGARRRAVSYYRGCVDLAVLAGAPAIGLIPAPVGRLDARGGVAREWELAVAATRAVAEYAGEHGVTVAIEAINRYETFLVCTAARALAFAGEVGVPNVGVILDSFHMGIEEADSSAAITAALPRLAALHLADSNRRGLGHGQQDTAALVRCAVAGGYTGPLVFEFTAPGPNPFNPRQAPEAMAMLDVYARASVDAVRAALAGSPV